MAARKPSPPKKKQKTPAAGPQKPAPAPRATALGNDPFARGSAVRPVAATGGPPPRPAHPVTPELQRAPTPKAHPGSPTAAQLTGATPHAGSPSVTFEPEPHAGTPTAQPLEGVTSHAGSPSVTFEPEPHAGAPTAQPLEGVTSHAGSPSVTFEPEPHAGSPTAQPLEGVTSHAGSPSVTFEPEPHAGSPSVAVDPRPHASAPTATPRAAAPAPLARGEEPASISAALKGLVNAVRTSAGLASRSAEVDRWGKDVGLAASLRPLGELLYEKYWRVRVEGAEQLPTGPFILVANHAGALPLDGPVLHLALRRERPELADARWLLEDQVFHAPFVGVLANRLGAVRASPENALRLLDEGRPLIVFPEGFHGLSKPFSERYQLRRFGRGGYVKIALRARVPIVPVAIVGGEESMPLLARLPGGLFGVQYLPVTLPPLPARWHIHFGAPLSLEGAPSDPDHDLAWVEQKNFAIRDQIESMLTRLLQQRTGVF